VPEINATIFVIEEIERINRSALRTYFASLGICVALGLLLALVGPRINSEKGSNLACTVASGLILLVGAVPGNAMFHRRDRIASMSSYRTLYTVAKPDSPEAAKVAETVLSILAKLGGD
jgi:hypothetical protein